MKTPKLHHIIDGLKNSLIKVNDTELNEISKAEKTVGICSATLLELREHIIRNDLKNKSEEIRFFKDTKSFVLSEYLYYSKLWEILIRQPVTSIRRRKKYLRKVTAGVQQFFNENTEFYLYYRSGSTHLDEQYFVRTEISCTLDCQHFIFDPFFSTSHDYTLAAIKANEKIAAYCNAEINRLRHRGNYRLVRSDMFWSLNKRDLMQVIYGIYYTNAVNRGKVQIKELVCGFESLFNVKLSGYYHTFYEITQLKKQPLGYLDLMKETLTKLVEEQDEHKRRKRRGHSGQDQSRQTK
ncbi:RteC protein [Mariniphaga anaerophila]|uniref:RteC protein n=1 Tax=Mariniphaga anaerophila TaxID=1484053 RepID=A0A1M4ST15_9BACT|nr:RteC domain-containing protein [Mariniphaga anaerophila]SHE35331.1 RteC protein [Mariniphaga anaerophila]